MPARKRSGVDQQVTGLSAPWLWHHPNADPGSTTPSSTALSTGLGPPRAAQIGVYILFVSPATGSEGLSMTGVPEQEKKSWCCQGDRVNAGSTENLAAMLVGVVEADRR